MSGEGGGDDDGGAAMERRGFAAAGVWGRWAVLRFWRIYLTLTWTLFVSVKVYGTQDCIVLCYIVLYLLCNA